MWVLVALPHFQKVAEFGQSMKISFLRLLLQFEDDMETIMRDMPDRGLLIYMYDRLMYSETEEEHTQIVLVVL